MTPDRDDPIIDALLAETLGGAAPPDLSGRIMQAWSEAQQRSNGKAAPPLNVFAGVSEVEPPPIVVGAIVRTAYDPTEVTTRPRRRRAERFPLQLWTSLAAVAAVLIVGYLGVRMSNDPQRNLANEEPGKPGKTRPNREIVKTPDVRKTGPDKIATPDKPTPGPAEIVDNGAKPSERPVDPIKSPNEVAPQRTASSDEVVVAFVNEQIRAGWKEHNVTPSDIASDEELCRRTFLRILGRIPTVDELQAYAGDKRADKHEQLVDYLLEDEKYADEFARHWSDVLANVLIGRSLGIDPQEPASRAGLQEYLQASLRQNKPYDRMALELISATGAGQPGADNFNGAANFLLAHAGDDATVATARTCRVFLGVQLQCVQCHDHPSAPLTQKSFWAMNAFLRQMKVIGNRNDPRELTDHDFLGEDGRDEEGRVFYDLPSGIAKVVEPTFIDGTKLPANSGRVSDVNRREQLAKLIVESKYFSRTAVNRLWSQFLGFGFTQPVDDMLANAPSHPELLSRVSDEFAASGYDLKRAMRWIALSDAFNRSSKLSSVQVADMPDAGTVALFTHYYTRQLPAEEVYRSLQIAAKLRRESGGNIEQARVTWLANVKPLADDGTVSPGIVQSAPIARRAASPTMDTLLHSVIKTKLPFEKKVEHLFLAALSRKPTRQELELAQSLGGMNPKNEAAALEDIWWALLNSSEFALDH